MGRTPSSRSAKARTAIVLALCTTLGTSGCALLLPPSWRGRAPVPLAGPISASELHGTTLDGAGGIPIDPAELSDERLLSIVESDRRRLIEIASEADEGPLATPESEAELREIANRLPLLQHELDSRATTRKGSSIRHPVIR